MMGNHGHELFMYRKLIYVINTIVVTTLPSRSLAPFRIRIPGSAVRCNPYEPYGNHATLWFWGFEWIQSYNGR